MQTPSNYQSKSSMVDSPIARLSSNRALVNFEKVNTNMIQLRTQLKTDTLDKQKFEEKRAKLFKKEEESLTGLRAATFNLRTIIGSISGASALRSFSKGNIGEGLQETGVAIASFLPEIIGITSNIIVGGLATKGLIGGGKGLAASAPKGKAGLMALPLLALAPLLMGAGRNNQGNSPTSEFRREQELRKTRKNIINSGDTERFGKQLDRFEQILDGMGGTRKTSENVNKSLLGFDMTDDKNEDDDRDEEGRDKDGKKNIGNQIVDFLSLLDPFKGMSSSFKSDEENLQDSKDTFAIFGTMFDGVMNLFRPQEAKAGTLDEFLKDGGVLPSNNDETNENLIKSRNNLMNISDSFRISQEGDFDFSSILGSTKGKEMEDIMTNFLGVVKTQFVPSSDDDKLLSIANSFGSKSINYKPITKIEFDTDSLGDIFFPMPSGDSEIPSFVDQGEIAESDAGVGDPFVEVDFKGSIDKFMNRLVLNINR
ncbi:MAG: hypothetical protein CMB76_08700 [Euryarchaeota archaeon]|nr:hypothetical protein [Euryarchaeota archaeon]|tara:strand:- start:3243 stop:4691 length:1449 start_codon:yes stop_codon:yes gene_type:complete